MGIAGCAQPSEAHGNSRNSAAICGGAHSIHGTGMKRVKRLSILCVAALAVCAACMPVYAQPFISYILPDVGTPDFNTYVEIIGPNGLAGNFGADGVYLNNPGDNERVQCVNPLDTNSIVIGPSSLAGMGR